MPVTYFVALPFVRTEEGIAAGQGQECPNESSAMLRPCRGMPPARAYWLSNAPAIRTWAATAMRQS
jgi:hypothetical protein